MSAADDRLAAYYAARAAEYERIYEKPERQSDLARLRELIPAYFAERDVMEVACGTGYWTQFIATRARRVVATDINEETLAIARTKPLPSDRVVFERADIYDLPAHLTSFSGAFAGFWWSHIPRARVRTFLEALHRALAPGATVVFLDNAYVEGSSTPIDRVDAAGDAYQRRRLSDGSEHMVLKNFPTEDELRADVSDFGDAVEYTALDYYWLLKYTVRHEIATSR